MLEVYGCFLGFSLLIFSYHCNKRLIHGLEQLNQEKTDYETKETKHVSKMPSMSINILTQLFIVLAFDQICIVGTLYRNKMLAKVARYPIDIFLFISFTLPIFLHSILGDKHIIYIWSPKLSILLPLVLLLIHSFFVILTIIAIVFPVLRNVKVFLREMGIDGLLMRLMEQANMAWLLRIFFLSKVVYYSATSDVLAEGPTYSEMFNLKWSEVFNMSKLLVLEVVNTMCETILSVMSMASIISVISGGCLSVIYNIIGANEEEESFQPAVSGFLFVLLAMQTGITSIASEARLQLLFQNCILLLVANQHFIQTVAAELLLKASTDDILIKKHLRPLLPYFFFFSFPFLVVLRLWQYPFRISWLLAISAFSLELVIKSITTLAIYSLNMLQSHIHYLHEHLDDFNFYIKAVCGCLEFCCGIFLFLNGAYIFIFESGGVIRFVMMIIHLYCNIYQTAVKGLATYKLRQSAWEKVNKLQAASQEQLDENDDICPICYQDMTEAVVVKCSHVFHKNCLQKWLSIKENCPLCHVDLRENVQPKSNNTEELAR